MVRRDCVDVLRAPGVEKYEKPCVDALVESAMYHIRLLEKFEFFDIIVSLKSSNVKMMVEAYRKISSLVDYPLHLGVTEAGTKFQGTIKSAIGIGTLLVDGIGDTLRVSLTENPVEEIKVAKEILKVLDLSDEGVEIISLSYFWKNRNRFNRTSKTS